MATSTLSLSRELHFDIISSSEFGGPLLERQDFIPNRDQLVAFFDGQPSAIAIDFNMGFILAIALGQRPTGGYGIKINSIGQATSGIMAGLVTVYYEEMISADIKPQVITAPYIIVCIRDMQYATQFNFQKMISLENQKKTGQYKVICLTGTGKGCQKIPADAYYPAIYSVAYGPASEAECQKWIEENCY